MGQHKAELNLSALLSLYSKPLKTYEINNPFPSCLMPLCILKPGLIHNRSYENDLNWHVS